jgi:hypothetical protein
MIRLIRRNKAKEKKKDGSFYERLWQGLSKTRSANRVV